MSGREDSRGGTRPRDGLTGGKDMFVIVSGLDEVNAAHPELPIEQRFRKVMEISGVSITVTSP